LNKKGSDKGDDDEEGSYDDQPSPEELPNNKYNYSQQVISFSSKAISILLKNAYIIITPM
jgi:hypothetical protein